MLLLWAWVLAQATPESWVETLGSDRAEIRTQAERELFRLGSQAIPALTAALRGEDPDLAGRARECLQRILDREELTPRLLAIPGLEERLRREGGPAWHAVFMEALHPGRPEKPYDQLDRGDLAALARGALKRDDDAARRVLLFSRIGMYRLEGARPNVEAFLRDEEIDVRAWAAWTIVMLRGPQVLQELDRFLDHPTPEMRSRVFGAVVQSRITEAIPRLLAMTPADGLSGVQLEGGLFQLGVKRPTPLTDEFLDDPQTDQHWRMCAAMMISFYGSAGHLPQMRRLLRWWKKDPNTADYALNYLGDWGDRASLPAVEDLIQTPGLWANNPYSVCRALYSLGAKASVPALLRGSERGYGEAVVALGKIGDPAALPALRTLLAKYPGRATLLALGRLGDRESAPALRKALVHESFEVREAACTALALLQDDAAAKDIAALMWEARQARKIWPALGDDGVPDAAVYSPDARGNAGPSEFAPQLQEGSNTAHGYPRYLSVRASATAKAAISTDELLQQLKLGWHVPSDLTPAAALVRRGRVEGIEPLLDARRPLFSLNRLRRPAAFARLEQQTIRLRLYGTYEEIHRRLAREAGLKLEGPPTDSDAHQAWANMHQTFEKWGAPPSIAQGFDMHEDDRWCVVLEDDCLRILPLEEGMTFWRAWQKTLGK